MHKLLTSSLMAALPAFEACARHLSFTRAAHELHVTSGAVSQQIRQLEERLGCPLFNRLGRSVTLTPAGETLLGAVDEGFRQLSHALSAIGEPSGPLQLSCSPSFAMLWLMPRLRGFYQACPGIEIRLVAEFQGLDRASFSAGQIDAAIRYDATDYKGMEVVHLMDEYLFPVASPSYVASHREALMQHGFPGLSLLQDVSPWDGARPDTEWRAWLASAAQGADAASPATAAIAAQDFNLFMMALSAARNHEGICMARAALVHDELRSGTLVHFTGATVASPASYKLLSARADDIRVHAFREWLQKETGAFFAASQRSLAGQ